MEAVLETQELAEALEAGMELEGMEDKARAGAQAMASQSTTGRKRGRRGRSRPIRSIPVVVGITRRRSIPVVVGITRRSIPVVVIEYDAPSHSIRAGNYYTLRSW